MTTTVKAVKRSIASLNLPRPVPALISMAKGMINALNNNPNFPSPDPSVASLTPNVAALEAAQTAVQARTRGAVAARNDKRKTLATSMERVKAYVQSVADTNPDTAENVIQSAGMSVRKPVIRQKQVFTALDGDVSGSIKLLTASVAHRASYEWQNSLDGGKTWLNMPTTLQARTEILGLTVGQTVMFRSRAVTKTGEGDWTQPVSITVR